jgi:hypothetical protein
MPFTYSILKATYLLLKRSQVEVSLKMRNVYNSEFYIN